MSRSNNLAGGIYNEGDNTFTLPTTRGANSYVLTRDNTVDSNSGKGTTWKATELAPETTSISPNEVASADDQTTGGNQTFTLTGTNFAASGMTVTFLANSGSDITSGITVTHGTSTSFTVTVARSSFVDANEPYSIKVTKSSGLTHTLADALRVDNAPSFSTYVGTLSGSPPVVASIMDNISSATHATLSAVDAEGDAVTYSETTNTLTNAGMTLSSAGAITGTPTAVSSDTNYDFTARATSTGDGGATTKTTDQNFRFTITNYIPPLLFSGFAYSGSSSSQNISLTSLDNSVDSKPDLVWIKERSSSQDHYLFDRIRGHSEFLSSNQQTYEDTDTTSLTGFLDDGFSLAGGDGKTNENSQTYVAWSWQAGGAPSGELAGDGATATLTNGVGNGTIHNNATNVSELTNITQSVNRNTGFCITKYSGDSQNATGYFPHNLGAKPDFIIVKCLNASADWICWHKDLNSGNAGSGDYICLNGSKAKGHNSAGTSSADNYFASGIDNDRIDIAGGLGAINTGGRNYICYAWKAVGGVSCFGKHTGTVSSVGSTLGEQGNCGFQPRFVLIKRIDGNASWALFDSFRGGTKYLEAESSNQEGTGSSIEVTFQSNGFTTGSHNMVGGSGQDYISIAFA